MDCSSQIQHFDSDNATCFYVVVIVLLLLLFFGVTLIWIRKTADRFWSNLHKNRLRFFLSHSLNVNHYFGQLYGHFRNSTPAALNIQLKQFYGGHNNLAVFRVCVCVCMCLCVVFVIFAEVRKACEIASDRQRDRARICLTAIIWQPKKKPYKKKTQPQQQKKRPYLKWFRIVCSTIYVHLFIGYQIFFDHV